MAVMSVIITRLLATMTTLSLTRPGFNTFGLKKIIMIIIYIIMIILHSTFQRSYKVLYKQSKQWKTVEK